MVRKALERLWKDACTITEYQEYTKVNKSTGHRETVVFDNLPCKLSFSTIQANAQTETAATLIQKAKLFIAPDVIISPGSKITVHRGSTTFEYKSSGEPAVFSSHQEIVLDLFEGWS